MMVAPRVARMKGLGMKNLRWMVVVAVALCVGGRALADSGDGNHITVRNGTYAFTGLVLSSEGGTGANNTATADRYLKGNGTNFLTSAGAAAGTGTCTNQFARALNSDAAPTCATVSLTADVTGLLPLANGGTAKLLVAANGQVAYSDADSLELTTSGTTGQCLKFNSAAAPTWGTCSTAPSPIQALGGRMDITTTQTVFLSAGGGMDTTEAIVTTPYPAATLANLRCNNTAIQGTANNIVITGRVGACGTPADGTLTCTITGTTGANQSCSDLVNSLAPTAGQCVSLKVVTPAAMTANARVACTWQITA